MRVALERHDFFVRSAIDGHNGYVFSTGGDGFAAAFARAGDALQAAVDAQAAVADEAWPDSTPMRVRMGLHTGEVEEREGDYLGAMSVPPNTSRTRCGWSSWRLMGLRTGTSRSVSQSRAVAIMVSL